MQIKVKKDDGGNPDADFDMILNKAKHDLESDSLLVRQHTEGNEITFIIEPI